MLGFARGGGQGATPELDSEYAECAFCEMQSHADSKGKVALDDVTLWANRCTKYHDGNIVSNECSIKWLWW